MSLNQRDYKWAASCLRSVTDQNFELQYPEIAVSSQNSSQLLDIFGSQHRAGWRMNILEKFSNWATFANSASAQKGKKRLRIDRSACVLYKHILSKFFGAGGGRCVCIGVCAFTYAHTETWKLSARAHTQTVRWAARVAECVLIIHVGPTRWKRVEECVSYWAPTHGQQSALFAKLVVNDLHCTSENHASLWRVWYLR